MFRMFSVMLEDNIKVELIEIGHEDVDLTLNQVMYFRVS
jgi:hypothetical protein